MVPGSPFLDRPPEEWVASNALAFAIRDAFPVSPGHTLIVPRRLIAAWFETTAEERKALFDLVDEVRKQLDAGPVQPAGYNIGINVGDAAGQTVAHVHVHLIPRYRGDVSEKADRLAAFEHLERWCARNTGSEWTAALEARMLPHDSRRTKRVAGWAYSQAEAALATVWQRGRDGMVDLDPRWRALLRC
jgi:diadenosine tetraphosphate (Ap4A) HIT family hydrolase